MSLTYLPSFSSSLYQTLLVFTSLDMMASALKRANGYLAFSSWQPLTMSRRSHRAYFYTLLALLLLLIFRGILSHRQDYWSYLPFSPPSDMRYLSSGIIRPGDLVTSTSREVRPHDDSIPPAHEPIGFGTLRDVRYVLVQVSRPHLVFEQLLNLRSTGKRISIAAGLWH